MGYRVCRVLEVGASTEAMARQQGEFEAMVQPASLPVEACLSLGET